MHGTAGASGVDCSVFGAVEAVGDAWSWLVLSDAILDGVTRFDSFQGRLGIARSTLSARLSSLCANGLMARHRRDYLLTEKGAAFFDCMMTAMAWGDRWSTTGGNLPRRAAHIGCADLVHGELRCAACHGRVRAGDVSFDRRPRPAAELAKAPLRRRAPGLHLLQRSRPSSIAATLEVIGDRWSALVIRECFYGTSRFDDFQHRLGIASNILTHRLQHLAQHDILARTAYQNRPARHDYRLTERGLDLYPVPLAMLAWGDRWVCGGRPPVRLTHNACGHPLSPRLCCTACAEPISRSRITFDGVH